MNQRFHSACLAAWDHPISIPRFRLHRHRGVAPTVAWLAEEFGELAQAVRKGTRAEIEHEFSDVLAWLATLANQVGVDLTAVVDRYRAGCPKCARIPCAC